MSNYRIDIESEQCSCGWNHNCPSSGKKCRTDNAKEICLYFRADCGGDEISICEDCLKNLLLELQQMKKKT